MVLGWRRAFCTSIPREQADSTSVEESLDNSNSNCNTPITTPKSNSRFNFFTSLSNPSTPKLHCRTTTTDTPSPSSLPNTPKLQCHTNSPRSPFHFLKSSLRLHTRRCGLCLQRVTKGHGSACFTAECSHAFHYVCISDHVNKHGSLSCPVCSCLWKEMPLLSVEDQSHNNQFVDIEQVREKLATRYTEDVTKQLKVYNDDEPLACLTPKARFNPIPESDENCDEEDDVISEFKGFCVNNDNLKTVEVRLLPEAAVIAASRRNETYAVVMKVKAPPARDSTRHRPPVDLVTVVDVSGKMSAEKLHVIKKAMRSIVSSLTSSDRLSIVAFSSYSKRLLPLRRMTITGRRSARRIVEAMAVLEGSSNAKDAVKKAIKVLEDRREKNTIGTIILLSEVMLNQSSSLSTARVSHARVDIPVHSLKLIVTDDHVLVKFINNLLHVPVQDLRLNLGVIEPAVIAAVYSRTPHPIVLGSSTVHIGNLSTDEEKELLIEIKVPSVRAHTVLSVRCSFRESFSQEIIYGNQQSLLVPKPSTARSSSPTIQRLRNLFITTRALAESRRLSERNDIVGAYHMLVSARALIQQGSSAPDEFMFGLEAELSEMKRRRKVQASAQAQVAPVYTDEKGEPLTPTSAWRVADKLAKVAMMRKSVNRVSDLHGFEDARF